MDDYPDLGPPPDVDPGAARTRYQPGKVAVAVVLAVAAAAAALIGTRASMTSSNAVDAWQSGLRTEVKRSVAAVNDVSYLYQVEFPEAVRILPARLIAEALRAAEAGQGPEAAQALEAEASVQQEVADALSGTLDLSADPSYALPSGGFDLGRRLADIRAGGEDGPELLALDPAALTAEGDRLAHKASLLTYALIPVSLGAFLGIVAEPLKRRRRRLLGLGLVALVCGAVMALIVEVVA